ncbi:MAG: UDP-N-acetylmuramate dehydrogenase [Candidatus Ratteibacteria bacterium]|nr:UDP-N-acetylmuramate dehydrogenase [Candidatus Ratteibacteria bacterium]
MNDIPVWADMSALLQNKSKLVFSKIEENIPLAEYTTFGVGGNADYFCLVRAKEDLSILINWCKDNNFPFLTIGNGSNLLINDKGFGGLVIKLGNCFKRISCSDETIIAGAGVSLPVLLKEAANHSLGGLEPLAGIPGTVGGAVITNAGTHLGKMGDVVSKLTVMDFRGERKISKRQVGFSYRESNINPREEIVLEVEFSVFKKDKSKIKEEMKNHLEKRKRCQPWNLKSAGCVFKNPPQGPAAKFIEEAGLKGLSRGGAEVSRLHANFIINTGAATSGDISELIRIIQDKVQKKFGIFLETEIRIV